MPQTYAKPPITEAVIEVRPSRAFTPAEIKKLESRLESRYPNQDLMFGAQIKFDSNKKVTATLIQEAKRLSSADGADFVILKPNAFAISRLAPYCGWERFSERFSKELQLVQSISKIRTLTRIGLRYVNRIDVPMDGTRIRIEDHMTLTVNTPRPDDIIDKYTLQVVFDKKEQGCKVTVNSGLMPPPLIGMVSFLLDIDVSSNSLQIPIDDVGSQLELMRDIKNSAFESFITDRTRNLFY